MRKLAFAGTALAILVTLSCSQVMMQVGKAASAAMQGNTGNVEEVTAQIKLAKYHRDYPFTDLVVQYLSDKGIDATSIGSYTSLFLTKGMKFMEIDGLVQCNGQEMDFVGSGTYIQETDVRPGDSFAFHLKGNEGGDESFTEAYQGQGLQITAPAPGATIDLSEGFDIEWTAGNDPSQSVKVTMFISQMGLQNSAPLWVFPDNGRATVTAQMIGEVAGVTAQKIVEGDNYLIVERQKDEVRYVLAGDAIVMNIDGDAIPVMVTGKPAKAKKPVVAAAQATAGEVTINVGEMATMYSPRMAMLSDIRTVGLSSFAIQGRTSGEEVKKSSVTLNNTTFTTTRTRSWAVDFGEEFLTTAANEMARMLMAQVTSGMGAREVPTARVVETKGYQRMNDVEVSSDMNSFYITARNTTAFDGLKQLKIRIGGINSWYYDMLKASGSDALVECHIKLERQVPAEGHEKDKTFNVTAEVSYRVNPTSLTEFMQVLPAVTASWTSETFTGTELSVSEFLGYLKYGDFVQAYGKSLQDLGQSQRAVAGL